jgi:hypothetical protein
VWWELYTLLIAREERRTKFPKAGGDRIYSNETKERKVAMFIVLADRGG